VHGVSIGHRLRETTQPTHDEMAVRHSDRRLGIRRFLWLTVIWAHRSCAYVLSFRVSGWLFVPVLREGCGVRWRRHGWHRVGPHEAAFCYDDHCRSRGGRFGRHVDLPGEPKPPAEAMPRGTAAAIAMTAATVACQAVVMSAGAGSSGGLRHGQGGFIRHGRLHL